MIVAVVTFTLAGLGLAAAALAAGPAPVPGAPLPAARLTQAPWRRRLARLSPGSWGRGGSSSWFGRGLVQLQGRPPARRALGLGLVNALLPCGWLWAFLTLAASTGAPLSGAATMLTFWLGTVPALLGATALAAPLVSRLRSRWPLVTAGLVLGLAGTALLLRVPLLAPPGDAAHPPSCHGGAAPPALSEAP
jgi:hypothetical protein